MPHTTRTPYEVHKILYDIKKVLNQGKKTPKEDRKKNRHLLYSRQPSPSPNPVRQKVQNDEIAYLKCCSTALMVILTPWAISCKRSSSGYKLSPFCRLNFVMQYDKVRAVPNLGSFRFRTCW
jgi:hypothetical protein